MQFAAFWCIERDRRGWRSSVAIAEKIITFLMDKKSITKGEMKVRSRIRRAAIPSSLAHRSWKLIHSLQTYKGTQWSKKQKLLKKVVSMGYCPLNRSCTAQFWVKGFSGNCLEHRTTKKYYALAEAKLKLVCSMELLAQLWPYQQHKSQSSSIMP